MKPGRVEPGGPSAPKTVDEESFGAVAVAVAVGVLTGVGAP